MMTLTSKYNCFIQCNRCVTESVSVLIVSKFSDIIINGDQTISIVLKYEDSKVITSAPITCTVNGVANATITDKDGKFLIAGENGEIIIIKYEGYDNITGTNTTLTLNNSTIPSVIKF